MNAKDIVNRDLVNLANCESEPIHIPGSIQPHGFLMGVSADNLQVEYCSGNVEEYTGIAYDQILGKSYAAIFGDIQTLAFKNYVADLENSFASPHIVSLGDKQYTSIIHQSGAVYIIEIEPLIATGRDVTAFYHQMRQFVGYMERATSLTMLCQSVADETRAITGYDRVMIYRFDQEYNGEVFAESKSDNVEAFLGLHYPHTDIPAQARELYCKNLIRLIADVNYKPVPIYTLGDRSNKDLDLTYSVLRSVSPIHVQYLHNMGVGASLSISLIHEGRLWGLIACHHYSPRPIDNYTRISAQLQGHFMTSQIRVREIAEEYEITTKVNAALEKALARELPLDRSRMDMVVSQEQVLDLCGASGVAFILDDVIYCYGNTPYEDDIKKLLSWFNTVSTGGTYHTSHLAASYADAKKLCASASGILFHSLDTRQQNCIIWFRPETIREINWAGDPHKAITKDKDHLSPRKSFAAWQEVQHCRSKEWQQPELIAAAHFAHALQKHIHTLHISEEEIKYRMLTIKLKEAYAELENLNWISSHDMKEPLRKIQIFASKIMESENHNLAEPIIVSLQKIQNSAGRMQNLINDVLSYSKVKQTNDAFAPVDLNAVLGDVINEVSDETTEKNAVIEYDALPTINGIGFLIHQLFSNLLRNSLKFVKVGGNPQLYVEYKGVSTYDLIEHMPAALFHEIEFRDNGIGFDNAYSQSIFKVFSRLHNQTEYGGTGVGLALCKKIMENHGGLIIANGTENDGAIFTLYFPAS